jgi:hypothetical protein
LSAASAFLDDTTQDGNVVGQGRYAGADRAGREKRRRVPRFRRRDGQRHCLYGQLRHTSCRIRQIRRFAFALFRPAFTEERDGPRAAIGQPDFLVQVEAFAAIK